MKNPHRMKRLEEEIREQVSSLLLFEVTDPLVKGLTLSHVVVTKDLGLARVYYETDKKGRERALLQQGLDRAARFIRHQLTSRLKLRTMPEIEFFYDETQDEISRVNELFSKLPQL